MQPTDTTASDRAAALEWLWTRVLDHVQKMRLDGSVALYEIGTDDVLMRDAPADDCFGWIDDCEARLGCDVADARAALLEFIVARDGSKDPDINGDVLRVASGEAHGRLHFHHPVLRGLRQITSSLNASPGAD